MVAIAIIAHGDFASGLKNGVEMIAGKQENFYAFNFDGDIELMEFGSKIKDETFNNEDGCIYVVDMIHDTPFNAALIAIAHTKNLIITGASLPLVLELVIERMNISNIQELVSKICESSKSYVTTRSSEDVF